MRKLLLISSLLIMSMFTLTACGKSNEDINVGTGTDATETNATETDAKYTLTDDEDNAFVLKSSFISPFEQLCIKYLKSFSFPSPFFH